MIGGFILGLVVGVAGSYFFFRNNPNIEAKVDEVVDEVVDKVDEELKSNAKK
ncbi:hypothetical protein N356_gp105 [Cellulophaga phage phi14:2]|uniref:Uncharacterized protein n=1 Tax=Cellulophaga phage phi14:2 TaxID=1327990 RepID=S0A442_9CAUD|nr:hypothetical protein N356_gp105 [Cellulophaga phage phi14:2]AGO48998.1 hypothetical protein Phi14:2_gp120 [Cellulophaga phage phi14:2]